MSMYRGSQTRMLSLAAFFAIIAPLTAAPAARAGEFVYDSCQTPGGAPTSTAGWINGNSLAYGQAIDSCGSGGALVGNFQGPDSVAVTGGQAVLWRYVPPTGLSIGAVTFYRSYYVNPQVPADYYGYPYVDVVTGDSDNAVESCGSNTGCYHDDGPVSWNAGGARRIGFDVGCAGASWTTCQDASGGRAVLALRSAQIHLLDNDAPTVTAGGAALDGSSLHGSQSLTFHADDNGSGVYSAAVDIDGTQVVAPTIVNNNGGACAAITTVGGALEFGSQQPCAHSAGGNLTVNTAAVADGRHQLTVTVTDAAGVTGYATAPITIDNVPPPTIKPGGGSADGHNANAPRVDGDSYVGSQLTAFDGAWTDPAAKLTRVWQLSPTGSDPWTTIPGATDSKLRPDASLSGKYVRIAVTATSSQGTTTVASDPRRIDQPSSGSLTLVAAANNGTGGDPASGRLVPSRKRSSTTARYGGTVHVRGTLLDASGKPIAGALIDVFQTVAGGARDKVATITTDAKGNYLYSPETRSDREITLGYAGRRGTDTYQSMQSLQVGVKAGIAVRLRRNHIRARGTGTILGHVQFDGLPSTGVRVTIYALAGKRKLVMATKRTDSQGDFKLTYRYHLITHATVPIVVHVETSPGLAHAADSKIVRQHIG